MLTIFLKKFLRDRHITKLLQTNVCLFKRHAISQIAKSRGTRVSCFNSLSIM
jgi:hypothetical protein